MNIYQPDECIVFWKTKELHGELSNMCAGFPLTVGTYTWRTVEALYQASRFPGNPEIQESILDTKSPMMAKMITKPFRHLTRKDWDEVRVLIMTWCVGLKCKQHKRFVDLLLKTENKQIVEYSIKDDFWGAKPQKDGTLRGTNTLGNILVMWRNLVSEPDFTVWHPTTDLKIPNFLLFGHEIS